MDSPIAPSTAFEITTDKLTFFRHFDKDYLWEHYTVLGKSMNQIARERGCVRSTVKAALTELGLKVTPKFELQCSKGQIPFGHRIVHGNLVPHQGEAATLNRMAAMRSSGASYGKIADWLNTSGIKTKNRAQKWDRPTVYKILRTMPLTDPLD